MKIHLPGLLLLALAGCVSVPDPTADIERSALLVQGALAAQAEVYAPVELRSAKERMAQARSALAGGDRRRAARWAAQGEAEAELAMARARLARLRAATAAQSAENAKLRAELLGESP
ncbi:MAG: DUF4398 domain-containing protein [Xanthomonadales bacterium]|nr:DUF4398 domain-containing protein [Xanthomonadales bacterium]MBK7144597.1 DUF4398 domain-containing protein [Xanthomonadales bacterium]MCC6561900.1 DUF4398 domain-containing protein [Xanthomonadales bacterium]